MPISSAAKFSFFLMGLMSVSLRAGGTLPSRKDPFIIAVAHSVVIGLAALISQAGQGSREEWWLDSGQAPWPKCQALQAERC